MTKKQAETISESGLNQFVRKPLNILVAQTKGGAGKSTVAQQILAPYFLRYFNEAKIIELDDENRDSEWLKESEIETSQVSVGEVATDFAEAVHKAVEISEKGVIFDAGGNRTSLILIRELGRARARMGAIDAICIPIVDNRMSVENARKTLQAIKDSDITGNGQELLKRCFIALTRVNRKGFGNQLDAGLTRRYRNVIDLCINHNLPLMVINEMDGIENLAGFGRTVFELTEDEVFASISDNITERVIAASKAKDKYSETIYSDMEWNLNRAYADFKPIIIDAHNQLDDVLALIESRTSKTSAKKIATEV